MRSELNKELKDEIRKYYLFGDATKIAKKAKVSRSYISHIINNGNGSDAAVRAVTEFYVEVLPKRKKSSKTLNAKIKKAVA